MNDKKLNDKIREMQATLALVEFISNILRLDVDYLNQRKADLLAIKEASVESGEEFDENVLADVEVKISAYEKVFNHLSGLIK